jgi:hypothetical protein
MNKWQATFLGLKHLPRELSGFEIEAFFTSNFDHFERFYKPAATREGVPAVKHSGATPSHLVYSHDPDMDGRLLRQHGYVLIGTASFYGAPDYSYADGNPTWEGGRSRTADRQQRSVLTRAADDGPIEART